MSTDKLEDIVLRLRNGEKISLMSNYTSTSVTGLKILGVGVVLFGVILFSVLTYSGAESSTSYIVFAVCLSFSAFLIGFGRKRSVAVIDGDMIRFKNLMTGSKYTVKLNQLGDISLSTYQTGGGFFAQTINKTTVSFNIENKQIELVLLNSDDWLFGKEISAADIIWVAREEYSRKDENE